MSTPRVSLAILVGGHWHRLPPMTLEDAWSFASRYTRGGVYL